MDITSLTLLGRARDGAPEAWSRLDRLYRPFVTRWFRRQNVPEDDADDLTQDVLTLIHRDLANFEHNGRTGAFRTWLRTVCLNAVRNHRRRMKLRALAQGGTTFQQELSEVQDDRAASDWDREHDHFVLRKLLEELSAEFEPTAMQVFRRLAIDGVSGQEVARETGFSLAAVYTTRSRIMRRLREMAAGLVDDAVLA